MTSLKGDLRSIMGTPFGGVGHAVLIFSRVTRAAFNSDSVVLQLHDRIEMPEEADGKFQVDGLDPGPIRIELEGGTVHNHGWNIDLPDEGVWSLTDLVDAQVDWSPAVIGRAEAAARDSRDHADRAEVAADRVGTAEQVGVWAGEASGAADAAAQSESNAKQSELAASGYADNADSHANRAEAAADTAAGETVTQVRSEFEGMLSGAESARDAAGMSETNAAQAENNAAGYADFAEQYKTAAKLARDDAAQSKADAAASASSADGDAGAAAASASSATQSESGAAAYAQYASDAADRVGTAEQVGTWAQQAQDAADRIGTAEQVEGWADAAQSSASSASTSESKAKEYRDSAATAASSAVDSARVELGNIVSDAAGYATDSSRSAARAWTSETNAATHEANSLSAAERAEFAAEETIQQVSGDFATRNYADAKDWHKGAITADHLTMADVAVGAWNVAARGHAVRLGLPMDYGSLQVMSIGSSKTAFFIGQTTGMWINTSSGTTWGEWQHISDSDGVSVGNGAAGLKTVAMALTAGSALDGAAGRYRVLAQATAPVVRWRIHVESHRLVWDTTRAFTLGNVYIGNHSGDGAMSGQQQIKSGSLSVAAGDEWVSPWMDASLLSDETLVDLEVAGSGLFRSQATSWVYQDGSWVSSKDSPVSIWVELETFDQVPVVGMIGDSTGAGQGADRPVFDSALYIAARKHGFIPMAYVYPGSSMQSMNDYGLHIFQRWAHLDKPDSVIIQSGSNDIHGGTSASELQTRFVDLVETAEKVSPVVIGATVKARYPNSGDHQSALNAHNAFVKTRANGNRDYVDFYQAVSPSGTVASADAADAAHLSTSGHQKLATAFDGVTVSRPAWVETGVNSFTGTGSPEGNVAAPVGSTYTDSAATNGAVRWIKTSGTGTTGWRVEYGDTGWRDITSTFDPPIQSGSVRIRRTPEAVQLLFYYVQATDGATSTLSSSFGAGTSTNFALYSTGGANIGVALSHYSGRLTIERTSAQINGVVTLPSATAWPTSLPGNPM